MAKLKFYTLDNIKKYDALYNVVIGERSNGKTFAVLHEIVKNHVASGYLKQGAIIRRYQDDFKGKRGQQMFDGLVSSDIIKKETHNRYDSVYYYSGRWFLAKYNIDTGKLEYDVTNPFCYAFSLASMEHDKSTTYPNVTTVLFDEFLSRRGYLPDEFMLFTNVISTIVRQRTDVKIYMMGNTVNKSAPYFKEMGIKNIDQLEQGKITVYTAKTVDDVEYNLIAVEYADSISKRGKPSDIYFAFDNPKLKMITQGAWEIEVYPHLPFKFKEVEHELLFMYFIQFDEVTLQCEIQSVGDNVITFIHERGRLYKERPDDVIFTTEYSVNRNVRRNLLNTSNKLERKLYKFFQDDKVFYQDNEVGEIVRNYLMWCKHDSML